jgi:hypothetical protein
MVLSEREMKRPETQKDHADYPDAKTVSRAIWRLISLDASRLVVDDPEWYIFR